ncbi:PD-(D/E)XK nuclease-like domain-containing protein [Aliarcobacter butzleri]|uniref:PD-(D/E)XK nuclease-like domain-containing protein n=1 Tax=Aliarcobacter butzleri TaxID=28197 RepID=UPI003AF87D3B
MSSPRDVIDVEIPSSKPKIKEGILNKIDDKDYFAIKLVSFSSVIKRILNEETYEVAMNEPVEETEAMILGSAIHCAILEPDCFNDRYAVMPKIDLRTTIGRATKLKFEEDNQNKVILNFEQKDIIDEVLKSCNETNLKDEFNKLGLSFKNMTVKDLINGQIEKALTFNFQGLKCKAKIDDFNNYKMLLDVKSTQTFGDKFAEECIKRFYHAQFAFYEHGLKQLGIFPKDRIVVGVQTKKPYKITLVRFNDFVMEDGLDYCKIGTNIYKDILKNPLKYKSKICQNPQGGNIFEAEIPTYMFYKKDKLEKILNKGKI